MAPFFTFSSVPVEIEIKLQGEEGRRQVEVKGEKDQRELCAVYYDGESVSGQVNVRVKDGKKYQHDGIRIELIGSIGETIMFDIFPRGSGWSAIRKSLLELFYDRGNHYEFVSLSQELAAAGELRHAEKYDFIFKNVEKQYESYAGINVKLRLVSLVCVFTFCLRSNTILADIIYECQLIVSVRRKNFGYIHTECPQKPILVFGWKSGSRIAFILSSSTIRPSK